MNNRHTKARSIVAWVFGIYAAIIVFFNLPIIQKYTADWLASTLSNRLNTNVEIGSVNLGFLNRAIVNDLRIEDQNHKEMLNVARVSVSFNIFKLISLGEIHISTAQLYGTKLDAYLRTPKDKPNYQFLIDAFSSDDKTSEPIRLRINSLIVRHLNINYNVLSELHKSTIDPNHISIKNAGFNLSLKQFTPDSINFALKHFQAQETNSQLNIKDLSFNLEGNKNKTSLACLCLKMNASSVEIDTLNISHPEYEVNKSFTFDDANVAININPSDLCFINRSLSNIHDNFVITSSINGNNKTLDINDLHLNTSTGSIELFCDAIIDNYQTKSPSFSTVVGNLFIAEGEIQKWVSLFVNDAEKLSPVYNLGSISYKGNIIKKNQYVESNGIVNTDAGSVDYEASLSSDNLLEAEIKEASIDLHRILNNDNFGTANFTADATIDLNERKTTFSSTPERDRSSGCDDGIDSGALATQRSFLCESIPCGNAHINIEHFDYNNYQYSDLSLNIGNNANDLSINANSNDVNANFNLEALISSFESKSKHITATLNTHSFNPSQLHLIDGFPNESYSFCLNSNVTFSDRKNLVGNLSVHDIEIKTSAGNTESLSNIDIDALLNGSVGQHIVLKSDIADANIEGSFNIDELVTDFQNIISYHLPALVKSNSTTNKTNIKYDISLFDAPILHHYIEKDYSLSAPINIRGTLDASAHSMKMQCSAPKLTLGNKLYEMLNVQCNSSNSNLILSLQGYSNDERSNIDGKIIAIARNNKIETDIHIQNKAKDNIEANLFATTWFSNSNNHLTTKVQFDKSSININDSTWTISPSVLTYSNNEISCDKFRIALADNLQQPRGTSQAQARQPSARRAQARQYLEINGKASSNPNDSIVMKLNEMEVAYILDLVNFHSVSFGGKASGKAVIKNVFDKPDADANLYVHRFSFDDGVLGDANILAHWDREKEGIFVNAHIVDKYLSQVKLTGKKTLFDGVTDVNGYIKPIKEELELNILANNTHVDFLNKYLRGVCDNIDGRITGNASVVGPFKDINVIGDLSGDMSLALHATKVPYYIVNEKFHLDYHTLDFEDITIRDYQGNIGTLNGKVAHNNFANFTYRFDVDMTNLCAYNEKEFNSDKYLAQVWVNGDIHISGSDGHPLNIEANVTPCKGSVFAYDSATPDALINNSFIDFRDATKLDVFDNASTTNNVQSIDTMIIRNEDFKYLGDVYMNVNVNLNPNCEIKLRMDNTPDGYISTFGNGTFQAKYYNKGAFQLFGNYNINSGKYRLYLQDLVYRNLDIQEGSKVEFNGNPFDATLHLICKHEINSVPLSDLTATTAFSSNNKVKVECFLDITGHLDNMDLSFNFELPNVSEETRQLVKSMITSDEEMNKQMIYLLGFQRFYPNQLAQTGFEDYGTQAVNSLISSTISGQINQMLSNMIGPRSKWNFGTGITTGENGWQDIDVEGILSGRLLNDRLLINGNFGYRDNSLTNQANFIGDFEVKYRLWDSGDFFVKAYNQTNDRYFTKATLNTQGVGISFQHDFEKYSLPNWLSRSNIKTQSLLK